MYTGVVGYVATSDIKLHSRGCVHKPPLQEVSSSKFTRGGGGEQTSSGPAISQSGSKGDMSSTSKSSTDENTMVYDTLHIILFKKELAEG